jgi:hypothetical protein
MASNPSAAMSFGVEIELLISPPNNPKYRKIMDDNGWDPQVGPNHPYYMKDAQARNRHALRTAIAALLTAGSIPAIAEEAADYDKWSVLEEESLDEIPGYCKSGFLIFFFSIIVFFALFIFVFVLIVFLFVLFMPLDLLRLSFFLCPR